MARFLAIGECMVELAAQAGGLFSLGFAGDTFNTAWYARRCLPATWNVGYLSAVGRDALSDRMVAFMAAAGIDTAHVHRDARRGPGLYLIELDGAERRFAYWRGEAAARGLAADPERLRRGLSGADVVYLSGITLAILPPADRARLLAAIDVARAGGARVAFDPNLRPRLWEDVAAMRDTVTAAAGLSDIALPSFEDESAQFGDRSPSATAARYVAAGARLVVVKNGGGVMVARTGETETRQMPPTAVQVVDTTAAGDSFNAAFLAEHLAGAPLDQSMTAGARLALRVIGARGALVV